ncbi:MAG: hypothetical protein K2N06_03560 [Oscillospiraceae bacterium]|nr:hypothetical protein [Oscillospiraceae bacterium]
MGVLNMAASVNQDNLGDIIDAGSTKFSIGALIELVKTGVMGVFDMAASAFNFLFNNPLCAFMLCVGFAYTALSMVRKALRVAKRS